MNETFVVCPNCGATVSTQIKVESVRVDRERLLVAFATQFADHACPDGAA